MMRAVFLTLVLAVAARADELQPRGLLLDGVTVGRDVVVVGERGTILRSSDNAVSWQKAVSTVTATLTGIAFASDTPSGWAVGHDALILVTADAGRSWRKQWQGENLADSFLDVIALDARRVLAVGAYGLFVATDDGGGTWRRRKVLEEDHHLNRISRGPTGTLYLAGEHGTLLRSTDDGRAWTRIPAAYDGSFYGVLPLGPRRLVAYGLRGHVFRSDDDGATWTAVPTPQSALLATAVRTRGDVFVLAGDARTFLVSRDAGQTIGPWYVALPTATAELIETPDGHLLALGEAGASVLAAPR